MKPKKDQPPPKPPRIGSSVTFSRDRVNEDHDGIADVLSQYVTAPVPAGPRLYRSGEVSLLLAVFALAMLLLDAEGLLTWARRLEVGRVQGALVSTLEPLAAGLERIGLSAPRRAGARLAEAVGRALGTGEDPLLAEGWVGAEAPAPAPTGEEAEVQAAAEVVPEVAPPPPPPPLSPSGKRTVLLLGDSMLAGSLGTAIRRAYERSPDVRVVQATQTATGLSQPEAFDWMRVIPPLVDREQPRVVVVALGANDSQSLRFGELLLDFGSPAWGRAYRLRISRIMRALSARGARVLWLGLPPMRGRNLSTRAGALNRLFEEAAAQVPGVRYLALDDVFEGAPQGPHSRQLRLDDGIHYTPAGARVVARRVAKGVSALMEQ